LNGLFGIAQSESAQSEITQSCAEPLALRGFKAPPWPSDAYSPWTQRTRWAPR